MRNKDSWDIFNTLKTPLFLLAVFLGIGIWRGVAAHIFYLHNFGYIGLAVANVSCAKPAPMSAPPAPSVQT